MSLQHVNQGDHKQISTLELDWMYNMYDFKRPDLVKEMRVARKG